MGHHQAQGSLALRAHDSNKTTGTETREPARPTGGVVKGAPTPELEARVTGDATTGTESREPALTNRYFLNLFFNFNTKGSVSEVVSCGGSVPNNVGGYDDVSVVTCYSTHFSGYVSEVVGIGAYFVLA